MRGTPTADSRGGGGKHRANSFRASCAWQTPGWKALSVICQPTWRRPRVLKEAELGNSSDVYGANGRGLAAWDQAVPHLHARAARGESRANAPARALIRTWRPAAAEGARARGCPSTTFGPATDLAARVERGSRRRGRTRTRASSGRSTRVTERDHEETYVEKPGWDFQERRALLVGRATAPIVYTTGAVVPWAAPRGPVPSNTTTPRGGRVARHARVTQTLRRRPRRNRLLEIRHGCGLA